MIVARIGHKAAPLVIGEWLQGEAGNFEQWLGKVVLVEVFQVNCPGCFLHALPRAIELHRRYASQGLLVRAVATAFEDFDKNTVENLRLLLDSGEVIGETKRLLELYGQLQQGRWPHRLPFPVAMDQLTKLDKPLDDESVDGFIRLRLADFQKHSSERQRQLKQQVAEYLLAMEYRAETFERFALQGTPSHLLVDKAGLLRACRFGEFADLEDSIRQLLAE